jgi:hypothetical protein
MDAEIKHLVQVAEDLAGQVPAARWPCDIPEAARMIRDALAQDRGKPENGGPGLLACLSKSGFASMRLHHAKEHVSLGSVPYVIPLVTPAFAVRDLFVLNLNAKKVRLFEYANSACREVEIPAGVPRSVDEANHGFTGATPGANRSAVSPSPGKLGGVHFGTGGDRESAGTRVERLCADLDAGLRGLLNQRPLLLMGVREEIAAFRRVSDYDWLLDEEVDGNWDGLGCAQIAQHAHRASIAEYQRMGKAIVAEAREMRDRTRASFDARDILHAAIEGRVHRLCVRADTELMGSLPSAINRTKIREDLMNAAVVGTLNKGGEVYVLPQEAMPEAEPICAVLRY